MTQISPYAGAILQSTQVQRQQAAQKSQQLRRAQLLEKNVAMQDDQLEHSVESSEELHPVHEDRDEDHPGGQRNPHRNPPKDDSRPTLDITG